ncbi:MAG: hypothetical protein IKI26_03745, partial [Prevotella sp.]|nr:hypothetical protein [Prevotella sp.]
MPVIGVELNVPFRFFWMPVDIITSRPAPIMERGDWLNILEGVPLGFNFFIFIFPEFVEIGVTAAA